ncbi:MAG TPA: type II secretion system F family protein, partial [Calditerricola sp.]
PETAMVLVAGGVVALFSLGLTVTGQLFIALLASFGGFYAPILYLQRQQGKRAERALGQMDQLCQAIAQTMRAGESLPRALAAAAAELDDPLGSELERVVRMITYGGARPKDAVTELQERIDLPEMKLFVSVVRLHLETGSNLPRSLDELSALIKDRRETKAVLQSATATARMQANILTALPIGLVFLIRSIYPAYFEPLFGSVVGQILFVGGLLWLALGRAIISRQFARALEG